MSSGQYGCLAPTTATLGVVGDPQYVDHDNEFNGDGFAIRGGKQTKRYFRQVLPLLEQAVKHWVTQPKLCGILQMGDIIDGL